MDPLLDPHTDPYAVGNDPILTAIAHSFLNTRDDLSTVPATIAQINADAQSALDLVERNGARFGLNAADLSTASDVFNTFLTPCLNAITQIRVDPNTDIILAGLNTRMEVYNRLRKLLPWLEYDIISKTAKHFDDICRDILTRLHVETIRNPMFCPKMVLYRMPMPMPGSDDNASVVIEIARYHGMWVMYWKDRGVMVGGFAKVSLPDLLAYLPLYLPRMVNSVLQQRMFMMNTLWDSFGQVPDLGQL